MFRRNSAKVYRAFSVVNVLRCAYLLVSLCRKKNTRVPSTFKLVNFSRRRLTVSAGSTSVLSFFHPVRSLKRRGPQPRVKFCGSTDYKENSTSSQHWRCASKNRPSGTYQRTRNISEIFLQRTSINYVSSPASLAERQYG